LLEKSENYDDKIVSNSTKISKKNRKTIRVEWGNTGVRRGDADRAKKEEKKKKEEKNFLVPSPQKNPAENSNETRNHDSPGRMAQTPRTGTGDSLGRFGRYR